MTSLFQQHFRSSILCFCVALTTFFGGAAYAVVPIPIVTPDDARTHGLESLKTVVETEGVPLPNNLNEVLRDRGAAEILGKALFHDMAAGSDGIQACVSCHFRAGADPRSKNQLSPGLLRVKKQRVVHSELYLDDSGLYEDVKGFFAADTDPDTNFEVHVPGPNYQLLRSDFPFVQDIGTGADNGNNVSVDTNDDSVSPRPPNSNDATTSMGVFFTSFGGVTPGELTDIGTPIPDVVFNVGGVNTRRNEPRNTPTTINAVFNFTQFWDGRANNWFNGQNPIGRQDSGARIFMHRGNTIVERKLNMKNASLASQASGPGTSHFEMSFGNGSDNFRTFPDIGRKLLTRKALSTQAVHEHDSLLDGLRKTSGPVLGLTQTYEDLIKAAFKKQFWSSNKLVEITSANRNPSRGNQFAANPGQVRIIKANEVTAPADTFTLMEANFALFWSVSIMLYEGTLVADETPFDNWMRGVGGVVTGFDAQELRGLNLFVNKGKCVNCHSGPELTGASVRKAKIGAIEPMLMGDRRPALYDVGFYNIGVAPTVDGPSRGGPDPFKAPWAFSRQLAFDALGIQNIGFPIIGQPIRNLICDPDNIDTDLDPLTCDSGVLGFNDADFGLGFFPVCRDLDGDQRCGVKDELLLQRVAVDGAFKVPGLRNAAETAPYFHNGGSATLREVVQFYNRGGNFCRSNNQDLDPDIQPLGLTADEEEDLVAFLIALTDPRVVSRSAPFDGPEVRVPNGHPVDESMVTDDGLGQATDELLIIPAVGAGGVGAGNAGPASFLGLDGVDHLIANPVSGGNCSPNFPAAP